MQLGKTLRWGLDSIVRTVGPKASMSDYVVLTPPFLKLQRVINKRTKRVKPYAVRNPIDVAVLNQTFVEEQYRLRRLARFDSILKRYQEIQARGRKPLIIDCGANIGLAGAYFADQFPTARIVGIEPDKGNVELARKNCPDMEVMHAAVSARSGRGTVVNPDGENWAFRVAENPSGNVEFVTLNDVVGMHTDCEPFIVKIDIEGYESELFSANTEWIDRFLVMVVELHDWMLPTEGTSASFLRSVASRNRDFVHIGENVFSIANHP